MSSQSNFSVVIDIGTSKIIALAGEKNEYGKIQVLAASKKIARGIKRGVIFNIDEAAEVIAQCIEELEEKLEEKIDIVNIAYAGHHMKTIDFHNSKTMSEQGIVTKLDIESLFNDASNFSVEEGFKIIEVIPTRYEIDGESTETNPVGTTGEKLDAYYKLVVMPEQYIANLKRVFDKIDIEMGNITLSILAVAEAVISENEKEMGSVVLDIGAGTTKLAVFYDNMLMHAAVIPFGGSVVTRDIKEGCAILLRTAEQLKVKYGQAMGEFADDQKVVTIPVHKNMQSKEISFRSLAYIIQARIEEILESANHEIEKSEVTDKIGGGIIITGGTSKLEKISTLVNFSTGMDARVANMVFNPKCDKSLIADSTWFTALGLLKLELNKTANSIKEPRTKKAKGSLFTKLPNVGKAMQGVINFFDDSNEDIEMN